MSKDLQKYVDAILKLDHVYYCVEDDNLKVYKVDDLIVRMMTDELIYGRSLTYVLLGPL